MTVNIETKLKWADGAKGAVQRSVHRAIGNVANTIRLEASDNMGRGQVKIGEHSAPGDPPNIQTGRLKRSISSVEVSPFTWAVGTNLFYGRIHELGNVSEGMIHPPRPWLRPAADLIVLSGRGREIAGRNAKRYLKQEMRAMRAAAGVPS